MTREVLIVSHADADGHIIAEQTRRNLASIPSFAVRTVVDPVRTKDHRTWLRLDQIPEIGGAAIVLFVDLMFAPTTFVEEAEALVKFVRAHSSTMFVLIDHHPLPLQRLSAASNLRAVYRPDVSECAVGPRDEMMFVAALCEHQEPPQATEKHRKIALGMKRAAALGGPLPGARLSALLRWDHWEALMQLGEEDASQHKLPRGRRASSTPTSKLLDELSQTADRLLHSTTDDKERTSMPYSASPQVAYKRTWAARPSPNPRDLEAIVTVLELAAVFLTTVPDQTFSEKQLIDKARELAGTDLQLREEDLKMVLGKSGFLKKTAGKLMLR